MSAPPASNGASVPPDDGVAPDDGVVRDGVVGAGHAQGHALLRSAVRPALDTGAGGAVLRATEGAASRRARR